MSNSPIDWVTDKLVTKEGMEVVGRTAEGFLDVRYPKTGYTFSVAVLGVRGVIQASDVAPLFASAAGRPQLIINIPSTTLWSGAAIDCVHAAGAAFGKLGDVTRAAAIGDAGSFRDKNMGFFIEALQQHRNVSSVSYVFDTVFKAARNSGSNVVVAVIDAYHMSAEDVRNAKNRVGHFDIVVKSSSYGSITDQAQAAANSMGAEALTFGELLSRLHK